MAIAEGINLNAALKWQLSGTWRTFLHLKQQKNINMALDAFRKWPECFTLTTDWLWQESRALIYGDLCTEQTIEPIWLIHLNVKDSFVS